MATVREARAPQRAIEAYCAAASTYAWPLYDVDPAPMTLSGADLLTPALLSYQVPGKVLGEMRGERGPYGPLLEAMREFVGILPGQRFESVAEARIQRLGERNRFDDEGDDAFGALVRTLDEVQGSDLLWAVYVTKVLHRKRPLLVPLVDSRVRAFYGSPDDEYPLAFASIHSDLIASMDFLRDVAVAAGVPELHPLRALDIIVWMQDEDFE